MAWGRSGREDVLTPAEDSGEAGAISALRRREHGRRLEQELRSSCEDPVLGAPPPMATSPLRPQPGGDGREAAVRFRREAVALALEAETGEVQRAHSNECACALSDLAAGGHESMLASIVRADPTDPEATWTVACYQIGDVSPSSLRDFAEAVPAVLHLCGCETPSHLAAELIVTNGEGVRWTALVRSGPDLSYQPLGPTTATAPSPGVLLGVRHGWEDMLLAWASQPDLDLLPSAPEQAVLPAGGEAGMGTVGMVLGQVLETVRHIEQRLPSPAGAVPLESRVNEMAVQYGDLQGQVRSMSAHLEASERRVAALESELRAVRAAATPPAVRRPAPPSLLALVLQWALSRVTESSARRFPPPRQGRTIELVPAEAWRSDWPG